ncbi:11964_t:CDS:2, partial [Acaulospora morrowiae]
FHTRTQDISSTQAHVYLGPTSLVSLYSTFFVSSYSLHSRRRYPPSVNIDVNSTLHPRIDTTLPSTTFRIILQIEMVASDVTSNFGILTPPALDSPSEVKNSFFPTSGSSMIKGKELSEPSIITAPPSVHDITDGSSEPSTPTSSGPVVQQGSRYYIYDNSILPTLITQIAAALAVMILLPTPISNPLPASMVAPHSNGSHPPPHRIPWPQPQPTDLNHHRSKSRPPSMAMPPIIRTLLLRWTSTGINSAHQDTLAGPSAIIIHRPVLLPDIVRSITQARRSRMRSRPVTRAKNKRENMEMELLKLSGLEGIIDTDNARNSDDPLIGPSRRIMANTDQRFMSSFSPSQISRSSATGASMSGDKKLARSSAGSNGNNQSYYHASKKRRPSASVSSLSSIPTSELSDYELNSDNFGDDEDDPDFTLHAKKRKAEYVSSKISHSSSVLHASHRRDSNNKTKICASCRTRSTPCWRPGWRNDLFLCNSCGLRYKKTKCVCTNPECRYIPLKSEYNAMFKKPKNGDSPDLKRCCKCQTVL